MSNIYFGGNRHPKNINAAQVAAVVAAVVAAGNNIHVGCQFGADQTVIQEHLYTAPSNLYIFAVAPSWAQTQDHIRHAYTQGAAVTLAAGGQSAPIPARFLLRSLTALAGCQSAVFFAPGAGSLSVARHALTAGIPVFIFAATAPALPVTAASGLFFGFTCWQYTPATQPTLF